MNKIEKRLSIGVIATTILFIAYQIFVLFALQAYADRVISDIPSVQSLSSELSPLKRSIFYKISLQDIEFDATLTPNLLGTKLTLTATNPEQESEGPNGMIINVSSDLISITSPLTKPLIFSTAEVKNYTIQSKDLKINIQQSSGDFDMSIEDLTVFIPSKNSNQNIETNLNTMALTAKSDLLDLDISNSIEKLVLSIDPNNLNPHSIEIINSSTRGYYDGLENNSDVEYLFIEYSSAGHAKLIVHKGNSQNFASCEKMEMELENKELTYLNVADLSLSPEMLTIYSEVLNFSLEDEVQQQIASLSPINILFKNPLDQDETSLIFSSSAWSGHLNTVKQEDDLYRGKLTAQFTDQARNFFSIIPNERIRAFMQNCATVTYDSRHTGDDPFTPQLNSEQSAKILWTSKSQEVFEDNIILQNVEPQSMQMNLNGELFELEVSNVEITANISSPVSLGILSMLVQQPNAQEAVLNASLPVNITLKST